VKRQPQWLTVYCQRCHRSWQILRSCYERNGGAEPCVCGGEAKPEVAARPVGERRG